MNQSARIKHWKWIVPLPALLSLGFLCHNWYHKQQRPRFAIQYELVAPNAIDGYIEAGRDARVKLRYKLTNVGREPLRGIATDLGCTCQILKQPEDIFPNESDLLEFSLRAPSAGAIQRKIPILIESQRQPLVFIQVALRVPVLTPSFLHQQRELNISFIDGDSLGRRITVETIERADSDTWIAKLETTPPSLVNFTEPTVHERPNRDPALTHRTYLFEASAGQEIDSAHAGVYVLRDRSGAPLHKPQLIRVKRLPRFTNHPSSPVVRTGENTKILVLDRLGRSSLTVFRYDQELIAVTPGAVKNTFLVSLRKSTIDTKMTELELRSEDGSKVHIPLCFACD
ncbi:hypothetical protein CA51_08270 [Rosistilla oblonga]|uniref:DUF1573 domain-containing protein n=2 Tax=Pseudomonadati TaxID=3379134 RepID=A0A518INJ3_9BACT|nr:hypothetical protein [Rosistilla oblonga]QDV10968.1 hypothetical protein CA51_08270 [Rosistilla oblonga]QDV54664.1 hypothetical protein Mal33_06190 [Rosistilla oblonga]